MITTIPRIAVTAGEPSGIGPDVVIALADRAWPVEVVVIADPGLLADRASQMNRQIEIIPYGANEDTAESRPGRLIVAEEPLRATCAAGRLDATNARYVIATLNRASDGCLRGEFSAMATAPVNKGIINDAGLAFSGHTEFLAEKTGASQPVMLLVAGSLRVALVTTHLALRDVPDAISSDLIRHVFELLHAGLISRFGIESPRIAVLGLNPHAGESGHLGKEEIEVIEPALEGLRASGYSPVGPLPADTAFTPDHLSRVDAVLAMYHDQGLPVLKAQGFGNAVNVTLGLPIIRTSVDHGTALDLAGTGLADPRSMHAALELAIEMSGRPTR